MKEQVRVMYDSLSHLCLFVEMVTFLSGAVFFGFFGEASLCSLFVSQRNT